jgi:hypothetical protein
MTVIWTTPARYTARLGPGFRDRSGGWFLGFNDQSSVSMLMHVVTGHRRPYCKSQADILTRGRMAVYGYVRVSTDRQADDGESLGTQQRINEGYR